MSDFDHDELVLQELKAQSIEGLTNRGRLAIREMTDLEYSPGAVIFLFLSLNSRIVELEKQLANIKFNGEMH